MRGPPVLKIGLKPAPEDDALRWIAAEAERNGLPQISIRAHEGKLLQLLMHSVEAHRVVEIGTLAGYSGVWLARTKSRDTL